MEITIAKTAGFCFGVKRAVDKVYEQVGKDRVYTFGPIIHNEEVVNDLTSKGISVINTKEELDGLDKEDTIIIRSHGVSKEIYDLLSARDVNIIDATCPFVLKIHRIVKEESEKGNVIIIIGNDLHPEVEGIKGWCQGEYYVIDSVEKAEEFQLDNQKSICIVSQTTFNYNKFKDIVEIISKKGYNSNVRNTICNATEERQTEAKQLAAQVDAMIVVGGRNSSNTQKLYEICRDECENTCFVQTAEDLDMSRFCLAKHIGITAGASTPKNIIQEVHTNVRIKF